MKSRKISGFWEAGLLIFIFIYVYQTPIVPKIVYPLVELFILLIFLLLRGQKWMLIFSQLKMENALVALIVFLSMLRDGLSGEAVYIDRFLAWWFQAYIFGAVVVYFLVRYRPTGDEDFPRAVYITGVLSACITLILYFSPSLDDYYKSIQLDPYYELYSNFDLRYRAYGFSENLTFTYGYLLGVFAGYSLLKIEKNIFFILPTVICLAGAALNARIGFISFFIFVLIHLCLGGSLKKTVKILGSIFIFCGLFYILNIDIGEQGEWVAAFFKEFANFFASNNSSQDRGTFDLIFGSFIVWPDGISEWLFGSGRSLFLDERTNTDLGVFLQLNYAGMFFLLVILIFSAYTSWRIFKIMTRRHWFPYIYTFSIFFLNFKGFLFAATPGGRLLFVLYAYYVIKKSRVDHKIRPAIDTGEKQKLLPV
ncbi:hypothetical protein M2282_001850 [Variovorax boronicumulans]|uniref:hypothetical protein n=1 Tax=Variovorax boronicumulans TaxID=436515 RepID=UPI002474D4D2|nr:hypothetical protein [Variovorax boronicumulans]MDH6166703.1 hypothetical protein [Variovorax boronicumulans]